MCQSFPTFYQSYFVAISYNNAIVIVIINWNIFIDISDVLHDAAYFLNDKYAYI